MSVIMAGLMAKKVGYFLWGHKGKVALALLVLSFFVYYQCGMSRKDAEIEKRDNIITQTKEKAAAESAARVNAATTEANNAAQNTNAVLHKDTREFSGDRKQADQAYCSYMCDQGVLDSTCEDWAKENNKTCAK